MKDNCENEQENTIQSDEETKREQKLGFPASITAVHTAKDNVNGLWGSHKNNGKRGVHTEHCDALICMQDMLVS